MPFEKGNDYGKKSKLFTQSVHREIKRAFDEKGRCYLSEIAQSLLNQAADGSLFAIGMLRDTLDGKPMQSVEVTGEVTYQPFLSAAEKLKAKIKGEAIDVDTIESSNSTVTLAVAHVIRDEIPGD